MDVDEYRRKLAPIFLTLPCLEQLHGHNDIQKEAVLTLCLAGTFSRNRGDQFAQGFVCLGEPKRFCLWANIP